MYDGSAIVNFCVPDIMSGCSKAGRGYETQKKCSFSKKSSDYERCRFEVFGEYCGRLVAQKNARGESINLADINGHEEQVKPLIWNVDSDEIIEKKFKEEQNPFDRVKNIIKNRKFKEWPEGLHEHEAHERCDQKDCPLCAHSHMHQIAVSSGRVHNHSNFFQDVEKFHSEYDSSIFAFHHSHWGKDPAMEYVTNRKRVSNSVLLERVQLGIIIPLAKSNKLYYDKEYFIYYHWLEDQGILEINISLSIDHLYSDFDDWTKVVPKSALPEDRNDFGFHKAAPVQS